MWETEQRVRCLVAYFIIYISSLQTVWKNTNVIRTILIPRMVHAVGKAIGGVNCGFYLPFYVSFKEPMVLSYVGCVIGVHRYLQTLPKITKMVQENGILKRNNRNIEQNKPIIK